MEVMMNRLSKAEATEGRYRELVAAAEASGMTIEDCGDYYEVVPIPPPTEEELARAEMKRLRSYLADTDWMSIKCNERRLVMEYEYPVEYAERQRARDRIDELEKIMKEEA